MKTETKNNNKRFIYDNINKFCDPNVYKLNTRQLMRHPLSDKYYKKKYIDNKTTAGNILNDEKPQNLILTINGTEEEVMEDDLIDTFKIKRSFFLEDNVGYSNYINQL